MKALVSTYASSNGIYDVLSCSFTALRRQSPTATDKNDDNGDDHDVCERDDFIYRQDVNVVFK
jgi:hypothetical protein